MSSVVRGDDNFDSSNPIGSGNFAAKAWINQTNGTTINASANISSLVDQGTGRYLANLTNSVASANAVVFGTRVYGSINYHRQGISCGTITTSSFTFGGGHAYSQGAYEDGNYSAGIMR